MRKVENAKPAARLAKRAPNLGRTDAPNPAQQMLLTLQRTAGNAAVGTLLDAKAVEALTAQRAGGPATAAVEAKPEAPSFATDAAETLALELGKTIIEKGCPPAKIVIIAAELGYAMADTCGKALHAANERLSARYEADISKALVDTGDGLTAEGYEALKDVRRWQANSVVACYDIIKQTMIAGVEKAVEIAAKEVAGHLLKKPIENVSDGLGKWVAHFVEEEQAAELANHAVGHAVEKTVEKCAEIVQEAFVKAGVVLSFEKGKEMLTETEAKKRALQAGATPDVAASAARSAAAEQMTFEAVQFDVMGKYNEIRENLPSQVSREERDKLKAAWDDFSYHYGQIWGLHAQYRDMGRIGRMIDSGKATALKAQLDPLHVDILVDLDRMETHGRYGTFAVDRDVLFEATHPK